MARTPEEIKEAIKAAHEELVPILNKHDVDIGAEPYIENGLIKARPIMAAAPKKDEKEPNRDAA